MNELAPWRGRVDVVSGGFPCQDNAAQHCPEENYGYSYRQFIKRQGVTRFELPEDDEGALK